MEIMLIDFAICLIITIAVMCLAFSNDETAKIARQAHKEGLLVKGAGKR